VHFDATLANAPSGEIKSASASTPKAIADAFIKTHVTSLQPQLASILEKLGLQYLDLLHSLYNKKSQISKMESNEEFIPCLAQIDLNSICPRMLKNSQSF
jgi:hypothetical protein